MTEEDDMSCTMELDCVLRETFTNAFRTGYVRAKGVCLPKYYLNFADAIENFKVRDDDIWVCSFPKSGITWTQEMVWCIANDLDFEGAKVLIHDRFPYFETSIVCDFPAITSKSPELNFPERVFDSISFIDKLPSPRFIKCHLPFHLLPREIREDIRKPKIVYITRDVKDTCKAYYDHCRFMEEYQGNLEEFCYLFLAGKLPFAPFWNHVLGFWNRRNNDNILFLKNEDMKASELRWSKTDLESVIRKTADFLGKFAKGGWASENIDSNIEKLMKHLNFENMVACDAVNYQGTLQQTMQMIKVVKTVESFLPSELKKWSMDMTPQTSIEFDRMTWVYFGDTDLAFT